MRVLLATDGSTAARAAEELVWRLDWPEGTLIRVVSVKPLGLESFGLTWAVAPGEIIQYVEEDIDRARSDVLEGVVRRMRRPGLVVEPLVLTGRPASSIVDEARAWPADLVVVGHRGRGAIETMLLGSVSAEVVDHAPCPVLVAREPIARAVILATDGSLHARHAEELVARWPMFRGLPIRVVGVAPSDASWAMGLTPDVGAHAFEAFAETAAADRARLRTTVDDTATRLRAAGHRATSIVLDGDPAATIVGQCAAGEGDLVVVGSRGHTGLTRLVLGSVARNVLMHAAGNVLVVRERVPVALHVAAEAERSEVERSEVERALVELS